MNGRAELPQRLVDCGWEEVGGHARVAVEAELARELHPGHALKGRTVHVIAKRSDSDDVLLTFPDEGGRVAVVHLTYCAETDPEWPHSIEYMSIDDVPSAGSQ
jgi:hypothetical protein